LRIARRAVAGGRYGRIPPTDAAQSFTAVPARIAPAFVIVRGCVTSPPIDTMATLGSLLGEDDMQMIKKMMGKLLKDEQGGEVLEYALILGLIVVAAIAVITTVGQKVVAKWESASDALK
jgi:Flp pilus assembly pilin Flp